MTIRGFFDGKIGDLSSNTLSLSKSPSGGGGSGGGGGVTVEDVYASVSGFFATQEGYRFNELDGNTAWMNTISGISYALGPAVGNGSKTLYWAAGDFFAVNAETGALEFSISTSPFLQTSLILKDGIAYCGGGGSFFAFNVEDETVSWSVSNLDSIIVNPIALVDGSIYASSSNGILYSLDKSDGSINWDYDSGSNAPRGPIVIDGTLYSGSNTGFAFSLDPSDGSENWRSNNFGTFYEPVLTNGRVIGGTDNGTVQAVDASDGSDDWSTSFSASFLATPPALLDGTIYIGGDDGNVHSLEASDGSVNWSNTTDIGSLGSSRPAINNDLVYISSNEGSSTRVYALNISDGSLDWQSETMAGDSNAGVFADEAQWTFNQRPGYKSDPQA